MDGTGRWCSFPFGCVRIDEKSAGYENNYRFTGKELDEGTGLYYYEARYYDSGVGRFVSVDPLAKLTPEVFLKDPQQLNGYAYVRNNPLKYVDVTGKIAVLVTGFGNAPNDMNTIEHLIDQKAKQNGIFVPVTRLTWQIAQMKYFANLFAKSLSSLHSRDPIVLVGHSFGGDSVVELTESLGESDIVVDLLITIDSIGSEKFIGFGNDTFVPENVKIAINFYQDNKELKGHLLHGAINIPIDATHTTIDQDPSVQQFIAEVNVEMDYWKDQGYSDQTIKLRTQQLWERVKKENKDQDSGSGDDE